LVCLLSPSQINSNILSLAVHKPTGISSAQALRDLQQHFNPSNIFAPWIQRETTKRDRERPNQRNRRREKHVQIKIGHGGTLDPLATGVLIAGVGKGTKALQKFLDCTKAYEAVILFGASTDTYDRTGQVLKRAPYTHLARETVEEALGQFRGKLMQLPPLYSALKMNGKPLYEYAREGREIPREIERRAVEVLELELLEWMEGGTHVHKLPENEAGKAEKSFAEKLWRQEKRVDKTTTNIPDVALAAKKRKFEDDQDKPIAEHPPSKRRVSTTTSQQEEEAVMSGRPQFPTQGAQASRTEPEITNLQYISPPRSKPPGPPAAKLRMIVTSGFYVRSLCHDLGEAVGSAALMAELTRTRQGEFELGKNVLDYTDLEKGEEVWGPKVEAMLDKWAEEYRPLVAEEVGEGSGDRNMTVKDVKVGVGATKTEGEGEKVTAMA
jgi:tRNA pseudouridine55 synthase